MMCTYRRANEYAFDSPKAIADFRRLNIYKKMEIVEDGISKRQLDQFKEAADLNYTIMAELMGVTDRLLHSKRTTDVFRHIMSDVVIALIDLYGFGYLVFDDSEVFNKWMRVGCPQLRYKPPLQRCYTTIGREETKREILRVKQERPELYEWLYVGG